MAKSDFASGLLLIYFTVPVTTAHSNCCCFVIKHAINNSTSAPQELGKQSN